MEGSIHLLTPCTYELFSDEECKDNHPMCSYWAKRGECAKFAGKDYMFANCKKSCENCGSG